MGKGSVGNDGRITSGGHGKGGQGKIWREIMTTKVHAETYCSRSARVSVCVRNLKECSNNTIEKL